MIIEAFQYVIYWIYEMAFQEGFNPACCEEMLNHVLDMKSVAMLLAGAVLHYALGVGRSFFQRNELRVMWMAASKVMMDHHSKAATRQRLPRRLRERAAYSRDVGEVQMRSNKGIYKVPATGICGSRVWREGDGGIGEGDG